MKNLKNYIAIFVVIGTIVLYWFVSTKMETIAEISDATGIIMKNDEQAKQWRDPVGVQYTELTTERVEQKVAQVIWKDKFDSLAKEWKVRKNQITGVQTISVSISDSEKPAKVVQKFIDTNNCKTPSKFSFTEGDKEWVKITGSGVVIKNRIVGLKVGYSIKDSVQVTFIQKHPLFGPIQSSIGIKLTNPHATLTSTSTYQFYKAPKRWGLGLQGGIGIDENLKVAKYIGIGINYNIIQW